MSNWAEGVEKDVIYEDGRENDFYDDDDDDDFDEEEEEFIDEEELWANAKLVRKVEADVDGNQFEVIKKVRQYHVDRPITEVDLRAGLKRFGKATADQSNIVSKEPPLALELGAVDQFERESRNEVKRLLHEVGNTEVKVNDSHLQIIVKEEHLKRQAEMANALKTDAGNRETTWGSNRTNAPKERDSQDFKRRVRVTNVGDNITEDNLRNIFGSDGAVVERVYLPRDRDTNQNKGFAFITFKEVSMAEQILKRHDYKFKNVVMHVTRALELKQ
ncbi:unnamed protein product [Phytomonas sp. Hart1]|nr:unnamed protein product [Phytomonas sp. Hart1]|eukprot:CCW66515.1 unnamed protein product [Phytomonas sp. isolate Hart1]